jgi:hypothetical protein
MSLLRPGQPAADLVLERLEGAPVPLSTYWGSDRRLLLIFLRHLA